LVGSRVIIMWDTGIEGGGKPEPRVEKGEGVIESQDAY